MAFGMNGRLRPLGALLAAPARSRLTHLVLLATLLTVACSGACAAGAAASTFVRGDVFAITSTGVVEYSPTGQVQQTLPNSSAATALCFDPSGQHLIVPGVGLFDNAGDELQSDWTRDAVQRCAADSSGHVYGSGGSSGTGTEDIVKYNLFGSAITTFPIPGAAKPPLAIALAPDQCTLYYGSFTTQHVPLGRWDGCTGASLSNFLNDDGFVDDLSVLSDGRVVVVDDPQALLFDSAGATVLQTYRPAHVVTSLRTVSLDPDGTSLWLCCDSGTIMRFDINSGQPLASWPGGASNIAVYAPPAPTPSSPTTTPTSPPTPAPSSPTPAAPASGGRAAASLSVASVSTQWPDATLNVACHGPSGESCAGTVTLHVTPHGAHASTRATTTIAARAYRVAAGNAARLSLALNANGRRLLADFYQLHATLTLSGATQLTRRVSLALTVIEASVADDWRWQCTPCSTRAVRLNLADLPSGTRIAVTCHGGGCPFTHRATTASGAIQVGTMLRGTTLQPGATVEIELTKAGTVGQDLLYRMRSHDGAVLSRLCLPPGAARPVSCRAT
jgi:hypothetical protein